MNKSQLKDISYIGDGVYVGHDGFHLWLFTDNGISQDNWIALEPSVFEALVGYYKRITKNG